jgi:protein involved in polysaccharide export with SLBB domain
MTGVALAQPSFANESTSKEQAAAHDDRHRTVRVSDEGTIESPLIGMTSVRGMTDR